MLALALAEHCGGLVLDGLDGVLGGPPGAVLLKSPEPDVADLLLEVEDDAHLRWLAPLIAQGRIGGLDDIRHAGLRIGIDLLKGQ